MTFAQYVADAESRHRLYRATLRRGQCYFNALYDARPDISERVRGNFAIDPFHSDEFLPAFLAFVASEWNMEHE